MPFRSPTIARPESNPALTRNPVGIDLEAKGGSCHAYLVHWCPTMPSETLTSCWTTSGIDSVALGARPTPKALIARR